MGFTHFSGVDAESLKINGTLLTVTAAELNALSGGGLSETELGYLDGVTAGTAIASKAVVLDASKDVVGFNDVSLDATGRLYLDGGNDTYLVEASADSLHLVVGGASALAMGVAPSGTAVCYNRHFEITNSGTTDTTVKCKSAASATGDMGLKIVQGDGSGDANNMQYATIYKANADAYYICWSADVDGGSTSGIVMQVPDGTDDVLCTGTIAAAGDNSGTASHNTLTGATDTPTAGYNWDGTGNVPDGYIKAYVGTQAVVIPYWNT